MLANPSHEFDGVIFGLEDTCSGIRDGNGKLKIIFGLVPEFAVPIELESHFLILDDLFQVHAKSQSTAMVHLVGSP